MTIDSKEQKTLSALLIIPTGGLNDVFNQLYWGLKWAKAKDMMVLAHLGLGTDYKQEIDELVTCRPQILSLSSFPEKERFPSIDTLGSMMSSSKKNVPLELPEGDYVFFGSGGGIRGSSRFLSKCEMSQPIQREMKLAAAKTNLNSTAIHLRCADLSPKPEVVLKLAKKLTGATVYSDCDSNKFFPGNDYWDGYSTEDCSSRSGSDLVSLLIMSMHRSLVLVPVTNERSSRPQKYSGFGLLALVMHLKRDGIKSIFRKDNFFTLSTMLQKDWRMLLAVIIESFRPSISKH